MECTSTTTNACSNFRWKSYPLSAFFFKIFACLIMVKGKMQKRSSEVEDFYILVRELMVILTSYDKRIGGMGYSILVYLECTQQVPVWQKTISTFGHFAWSVVTIAGIPETVSIEEYHVGLTKLPHMPMLGIDWIGYTWLANVQIMWCNTILLFQ